MKNEEMQERAGEDGKKVYQAPQLIKFGSVAEITAGGVGSATEPGNGMGPFKRP